MSDQTVTNQPGETQSSAVDGSGDPTVNSERGLGDTDDASQDVSFGNTPTDPADDAPKVMDTPSTSERLDSLEARLDTLEAGSMENPPEADSADAPEPEEAIFRSATGHSVE